MQEPINNVAIFEKIQKINDLLMTTNSSFLVQDTRVFYDEPPFYFFSGLLTNNLDYLSHQGYCSTPENIVAGGFSFESRSLAVMKCFAELAERFSLYNFKFKNISQHTYRSRPSALSPSYYQSDCEDAVLGWVPAENLSAGGELLVPAQLVYLNYFSRWAKIHNPKEPRLCQYISNGACFGFEKESTMLRGLYELIERDAAVTLYLTHYNAPRIDIEAIDHPLLIKCIKLIKQYRFKIFVFNMTNDLEIPTFLSILIDESSVGPYLTAGLKTSLNPIDGIIGSMEESFMGRTWVRHEIMKGVRPDKIKETNITNRLERALLYATTSGYHNLQYLLKSSKTKISYSNKIFLTPKHELESIVNQLTKKGFTVIASDIRPKLFSRESCFIYKMIVPEFQQLYLNEHNKKINEKRITAVRKYFNIPVRPLSLFPHPYL